MSKATQAAQTATKDEGAVLPNLIMDDLKSRQFRPEGKAGDIFLMNPDALAVAGARGAWKEDEYLAQGVGPIDTEDSSNSPFYDVRVTIPLDLDKVMSVVEHGPDSIVKAVMVNGTPVLNDGRTLTRWTRAANSILRGDLKIPAEYAERVKVARAKLDGKEHQIKVEIEMIPEGEDAAEYIDKIIMRTLFRNIRQSTDGLREAEHIAWVTSKDPKKWTHDRIAQEMGISDRTVRNRLALLKLAKPVQNMVREGKLNPIPAARLVKLAPDQQVAIARLLIEAGAKGDQDLARKLVREMKKGDPSKTVTRTVTRSDVAAVIALAGEKVPAEVIAFACWLTGEKLVENVERPDWLSSAIKRHGDQKRRAQSKVDGKKGGKKSQAKKAATPKKVKAKGGKKADGDGEGAQGGAEGQTPAAE